MRPARQRIRGIVVEILERAGVQDVETSALAVIAAMEGVLSSALTLPADERDVYVRGVGRRIITAFVPDVG